jgi:hypothetical protein
MGPGQLGQRLRAHRVAAHGLRGGPNRLLLAARRAVGSRQAQPPARVIEPGRGLNRLLEQLGLLQAAGEIYLLEPKRLGLGPVVDGVEADPPRLAQPADVDEEATPHDLAARRRR